MESFDVGYAAMAMMSTALYLSGAVFFKISADRMPPLHSDRPWSVLRAMVTSPSWLWGLGLALIGLVYQIAAFAKLPTSVAEPLMASTLLIFLAAAAVVLKETMTRREWLCVALFTFASVCLGLSGRSGPPDAAVKMPVVKPLALAALSLIVVTVVWVVNERAGDGRHARRISGVAYGIGIGVCFGTGESCAKGIGQAWAYTGSLTSILQSPYPYLITVLTIVMTAQYLIALQRCRIAIVTTVLTVAAKVVLITGGALLYGEPWPHDLLPAALRFLGFALAIVALLSFPRYALVPGTTAPTLTTPRSTTAHRHR